MIKNMSAAYKKEGRNMARVENQKSAKKVSYDLADGQSVGKSFGSEPSRGENKSGSKTRGTGAATRGLNHSSKMG